MGSLVAVRLPPGPAFLATWDRVWSAGDALLPLPHDAPDQLVGDLVERMQPSALVVPPPGQPNRTRIVRLEGGRPVDDGIGLVVATSGSTAPPRGVLLARASIDAAVTASLERLGARDGAVWLSCLPWHHTAGLLTVLRSRARGADPVVHRRFDVDAVRDDVARAAFVSLVPTQLLRLLDAGVDLSGLDGVLLGGAAAPEHLLDRAGAAGVTVVTSYGMTETCGGCVYDGVPLDGVTVGLDDQGTIFVGGPTLLDGYRDGRSGKPTPLEPLRTLDDRGNVARAPEPGPGWFATSDRGSIEDGRLVVHGRLDDVIVTGGENVSAMAVSQQLRSHPAVRDAEVIGMDDPEWGQRVVAAVVSDGPPASVDDLRSHVAAALGRAAAPRTIVFVDAIPRTGLGKPDRGRLRGLF